MQNKITIRYNFTDSRMALIKIQIITSVDKEQLESSYSAEGYDIK